MATSNVSALDQDNWQLISTTSFNGSSQYTLQTSMAGAYKLLMVVWKAASKDSSARPQVQFNTDTTAGNYSSNSWRTEGGEQVASDNGLVIAGSQSYGTNDGGYAIFDNCNSTTLPVIITAAGGKGSSGASGIWHGYAAVTSVNFRSAGGEAFTTGTVKLYGIAG